MPAIPVPGVSSTSRRNIYLLGSSPPPVTPTRAIATRTFYPSLKHATFVEAISYTYHDFRSTVTDPKVVFVNGYADPTLPGKEAGSGGICTYTAVFEYPIGGTQYPMTWGGNTSYVAADNEIFTSDAFAVNIAPNTRGVVYVYRVCGGSGRIVYGAGGDNHSQVPAMGADRMVLGSGAASIPLGTTFTATSPGLFYGPTAIVGSTNDAAALIVGDSIAYGSNDNFDATGLKGAANQLFGSFMGCINVARGSEKASDFVTGHTNRASFGQYVTNVALLHEINDCTAGDSAATIQGNITTIAGYFPGKTLVTMTTPPLTTSTDNWSTLANQTVFAQNGVRVSVNAWKLTGGGGIFNYYWDWAALVETSSKWTPASPNPLYTQLTDDGTHPTLLAARAAWQIPNVLTDLAAMGGTLSAYDPDAVIYFAAISSQPGTVRKIFQNYVIGDAKYWGLWTKTDLFYLFAVGTSQQALLNVKAPGTGNLTVTGSPTFTTDVGYQGIMDGGTYLLPGLAPANLPNVSQNSLTLAFWQVNNLTENRYSIGQVSAGTNARLQAQQVAGNARGQVFDASLQNLTVTNSIGLTAQSRIGAAQRKMAKNGIVGINNTTASAAPTAANFAILKDGTASASTGAQLAFAMIGGGLTDLEMGYLFSNITNPYMYYIGIPNQ